MLNLPSPTGGTRRHAADGTPTASKWLLIPGELRHTRRIYGAPRVGRFRVSLINRRPARPKTCPQGSGSTARLGLGVAPITCRQSSPAVPRPGRAVPGVNPLSRGTPGANSSGVRVSVAAAGHWSGMTVIFWSSTSTKCCLSART